MPVIKSAKKRVKVAARAHSRNLYTKRKMREALKAYAAALENRKPAEIAKAKAEAMSAIDTAAKKAVIHPNKAARFKSRLANQTKDAGIKSSKAAKPPAKRAAAKPIAKKSQAKKTASKKK